MNEKIKSYLNIILVGIVGAALVLGYQHFSNGPDKPVNKAQIVLEDEVKIQVGELGKLDASKSKGDSFIWSCFPKGLNYEVINGNKLIFTSGLIGEYTCVVSSAKDGAIDQKIVKITVVPQGVNPDKPDNVTPTPTPGNSLSSNILVWSTTVQSPKKAVEATALAEAYNAVAVQIEAGTLITGEDVAVATRDATHAALGESVPLWTTFLNNLQTYLKQETLKGTLVTVEDHVKVWKEISAALRQVR